MFAEMYVYTHALFLATLVVAACGPTVILDFLEGRFPSKRFVILSLLCIGFTSLAAYIDIAGWYRAMLRLLGPEQTADLRWWHYDPLLPLFVYGIAEFGLGMVLTIIIRRLWRKSQTRP
jgi:hypothetical protein